MRKKSRRKVDTEIEDYDTFYQKQLLPKELRNINPNLLKLIPRATANGMLSNDKKDYDHKREITEEEKKLITMKYNIKRLNTLHNKEMMSFKKIKSKIGKKKTFVSEVNIGKINDCDNTTQSESPTKTISPKKNERYSKIVVNEDDDLDERDMLKFQKALSMPLNFTKITVNNADDLDSSPLDRCLLSDTKIDEIEEDEKSVNSSSSSSDTNPFEKKKTELKSRRNVSEKKCNKNKKKFFIHKANSFVKQQTRSISPVKNVIQNIKNSSRKLKFMKLNSLAFNKTHNESKLSERPSTNSRKNSVSSNENDGTSFRFNSSKQVDR